MTEATLRVDIDSSGAAQGAREIVINLKAIIEQAERVDGGVRKAESAFDRLKRAVFSLQGALAGLGSGAFIANVISTGTEFDRLRGILVTVTGSTKAAAAEFSRLEKFAAETPFDLKEMVEAFARLKAMGLDPSTKALTAYGNTASSTGKSMMQFVEAVADAATGEYERLKEFGIKASKDGEKVTLTFKGMARTIPNDAKSIQEALMQIGTVDFAGAMDEQSKRLPGIISRAQAAFEGFKVWMMDGGLSDAVKDVATGLADFFEGSQDLAKSLGSGLGDAIRSIADAVRWTADAIKIATPIVAGLTAAFVAYKTAVIATAAVTKALAVMTSVNLVNALILARVAVMALGKAIAITPLGLAATAIGLLVGGLVTLKMRTKEATETETRRAEALKNLTKDTDDLTTATENLSKAQLAVKFSTYAEEFRTSEAEIRSLLKQREDLQAKLETTKDNIGPGVAMGVNPEFAQAQALEIQLKKNNEELASATTHINEMKTNYDAFKAGLADLSRRLAETKIVPTDRSGQLTDFIDELTAGAKKIEEAIDRIKKAREDQVKGNQSVADAITGMERENEYLQMILEGEEDRIGLLKIRRQLEDQIGRQLLPHELSEMEKLYAQQLRLNDAVTEQAERINFVRQVWEQAARNIQDSFADMYRNIFDRGIKSFTDLGKRIVGIFKDVGAQLLAAMTFKSMGLDMAFAQLQGMGQGNVSARGDSLTSMISSLDKKITNWNVFEGADAISPLSGPKGLVGSVAAGVKSAFGQAGSFLSPVTDGIGKVFKPMLKDLGGSIGNLGTMFGKGLGGAGVGALVSGVGNMFGLGLSGTGSTIGGAIGSFLPIPGGNIIGSIIGGTIGKLFGKKTSKTAIDLSTNATGDLVTGNLFSRGGADSSAAQSLGASVVDSLGQMAEYLGGTLKANLQIGSIGMRKDQYVFETPNSLANKEFGATSYAQTYDTAEAAVMAALKSAIKNGAIEGLSEASKRILESATDIEKALEKVAKIQALPKQIDDAIMQIENPFGFAMKQLDEQQKERFDLAVEAGVDLLKVEKLNMLERNQLIAQMGNAANDNLKKALDSMMYGEYSPLSPGKMLDMTRSAFDELRDRAFGGDKGAIDALPDAINKFLDASRDVNASSTAFYTDFERARSTLELLTQSNNVIPYVKAEPQEATAAETNAILKEVGTAQVQAATDTVSKLEEIRALIQQGGGVAYGSAALNYYASLRF